MASARPSPWRPANVPASTIQDRTVVHGITSRDYHAPVSQDDTVIAVMGPTGAGRSSFVNTAAGRTEVAISHGLRSKTQALQHVRCHHPDSRRNIVLVDTPGFDDTTLSETKVLDMIADYTHRNNVKLAGLLYLYRISDVRLARTTLRNLAAFRDLCSGHNLKNVIFVTTMWDEVESSVGLNREAELVSEYWKNMIRHGSRTYRYQGTPGSAWEIINLLDVEGSRQKCTPLHIKRQTVDRTPLLHETGAEKSLLRSLVQFVEALWAKMRDVTRWKPSSTEYHPRPDHHDQTFEN